MDSLNTSDFWLVQIWLANTTQYHVQLYHPLQHDSMWSTSTALWETEFIFLALEPVLLLLVLRTDIVFMMGGVGWITPKSYTEKKKKKTQFFLHCTWIDETVYKNVKQHFWLKLAVEQKWAGNPQTLAKDCFGLIKFLLNQILQEVTSLLLFCFSCSINI